MVRLMTQGGVLVSVFAASRKNGLDQGAHMVSKIFAGVCQ